MFNFIEDEHCNIIDGINSIDIADSNYFAEIKKINLNWCISDAKLALICLVLKMKYPFFFNKIILF